MIDFVTEMDTPLLSLNGKDTFTVRDSFNGLHVFGAIGSGKTSGIGKTIAGAYLRAGYGGLILTAKPEEIELWRGYCKEHGRESSMIVFDKSRHFNFLSYIFAVKGADGANAATDTLMKILKAADLAAGQGGKEGEAIWIKTTREMILNTITVLYSATGIVRMESIVEFILSMPTVQPSTEEARKKLVNNYALDRLTRCKNNPVHRLPDHTLKRVRTYWFKTFISTPEKMRGSVIASVCAELSRFSDGILRECFCTTTDIVPEMVFNGAVIIMGFPALIYQEEGIVAQQLFKLIFERAVESRNGLAKELHERPVFLYADESHYFTSAYDDTFLSTCRGSKCAVTYLTQSIPTYFAQLGKDKSDAVDGFVGKFSTKVFHLNACPRTNGYASSLIGRGLKRRITHTTSSSGGSQYSGGGSGGFTNSHGTSNGTNTEESIQTLLEPVYFATSLKTGSPINQCLVTAVWFKAGGNFAEPMPDTNSNTLLVTFSQR